MSGSRHRPSVARAGAHEGARESTRHHLIAAPDGEVAPDGRRIVRLRPQAGSQTMALATSADISIHGGAAGAGKTRALLLEPLRHIMPGPGQTPGFSAVIFRRTYPQVKNEGGLWDQSQQVYPYAGGVPREGDLEWRWYDAEGRVINTVRMAHMQHESTRFDWQGAEIPLMEFDELTHFSETMFFYMLSRNRSTCGVAPYVRASTNPDADSWVADFIAWWIDQNTGYPIPERAGRLRYFVRVDGELKWADDRESLRRFISPVMLTDPDTGRERDLKDLIRSVTFIPGTIYENKELLRVNPEYLGNLMSLNLVERERLLGGNWKIRPEAGKVFNRSWFRVVPRVEVYFGTLADRAARVRFWDKAATKDGGDWTVGVRMAKVPRPTEEGGYLYVVEDVVRGQWSSAERKRIMRQTAVADGLGVEQGMEQEPGSGGKDSAVADTELLAGYRVYSEPSSGDKVWRADAYAAAVQNGHVVLLQGEWNNDYITELHRFPDGENDDQVDGSSGAFKRLSQIDVGSSSDEYESVRDE